MQQGVQTDATRNIQQSWELLANNVASVCKALLHWGAIYELSRMLMRTNVDNDVSKDSTIEKLKLVMVDQRFFYTTHFLEESKA